MNCSELTAGSVTAKIALKPFQGLKRITLVQPASPKARQNRS